MKKVIFAILIVALAMLATTCDSAFLPTSLSSGSGQPAPVPTSWTTLSINVGNSDGRARAMNQSQNASSVDFYEVVFVYNQGESNSVTVRSINDGSEGSFTTPWNVTVPTVNYGTDKNKAVLFAGEKGNPNVLIAIGYISDGGDLLEGDGTIEFTLSAIVSGVTTDKSASSFKITGDTLNPSTIAETNAEGINNVPVFKIHAGTDPVSATYTFNIPKEGAVVSGAGTVTRDTVTAPLPSSVVSAVSGITPASGDLEPGSVDFSFTITPGTTLGHSKISIAVPVIALNALYHETNGEQTVESWSLRGGLENTKLDKEDDGGAVLLEVVAAPTTPTVTIESSGSGWEKEAANTWTYVTGGGAGNIVLTAIADGFADNDEVVFTWKTNSTGSTADPSGDDTVTTTEIDGVIISGNTLTIPSTSASLGVAAIDTHFYVYCIGDGELSINVVKIEIVDADEDSLNIPLP